MRKIFALLLIICLLPSTAALGAVSEWAEVEIASAREIGIITDKIDEDFSVSITREEYCEVAMKLYAKLLEIQNSESEQTETIAKLDEFVFTDTTNADVHKAYRLGIIEGKEEGVFDPYSFITREEACVILFRLIKVAYPEAPVDVHAEYWFDDQWKVSYWAKDALDFCYHKGIVKGVGDYLIEPKLNISREEAVVTMYRTYENKDIITDGLQNFENFEWAIKPVYDGLVPDTKFAGGMAAVKKNGKYGFIDKTGKVKIDFAYNRAYNFSNGMAKVENEGKYGFINKNGEICVPLIYDSAGDFTEGMAWVEKEGKYGFVDKNGNLVIPLVYDYAYSFREGSAAVKKDGKYGFINHEGKNVIDFKFTWACSFKEGRARITENGRYGFIDISGNIIIPCDYERAYDFSEERAIVYRSNFASVIDRDGKEIVPFYLYTDIYEYSNGLAFACLRGTKDGGDYGGGGQYLDRDGKPVIGLSGTDYSLTGSPDYFHEGLTRISDTNRVSGKLVFSYIDKTRNLILPERDNVTAPSDIDSNLYYISNFSEGYAAVVDKSGKLGFIKNPLFR